MFLSRNVMCLLLIAIAVLCVPSICGEEPATFSLPNSLLLFEGSWSLEIVGTGVSEVVSLPLNPDGKKGPSALPTLSPNGTLVVSGFPVANDAQKKWKVRCAVGIYVRSQDVMLLDLKTGKMTRKSHNGDPTIFELFTSL